MKRIKVFIVSTLAIFVFALNVQGQPAEPTQPAKPTQPAQPTQPAKITQPTKPAEPGNFTAKAGNKQVTLEWSTPNDGGSQIKKYQISQDVTAGYLENWNDIYISSLGANSNSYTITGLTNGTSYTFEVRAVNNKGVGKSSGTQTATPVNAPAKPVNFKATVGNAQVTLQWSTPNDGGSPITEYQVSYGVAANYKEKWKEIPVSSSGADTMSHTIKGLTNGTDYTFEVRAVNVVGKGESSGRLTVTPEKIALFSMKEKIGLFLFLFVALCLFVKLFFIWKQNKSILQWIYDQQKLEQGQKPTWNLSKEEYLYLKDNIAKIEDNVQKMVKKAEPPKDNKRENPVQISNVAASKPGPVYRKRTFTSDIIQNKEPLGFKKAELEETYSEGIFVITQTSEQTAELSVNDNHDTQARIFGSLSTMMPPACEEYEPVQDANRIVLVKAGALVLENGIWVIRKKMQIKLVKN